MLQYHNTPVFGSLIKMCLLSKVLKYLNFIYYGIYVHYTMLFSFSRCNHSMVHNIYFT